MDAPTNLAPEVLPAGPDAFLVRFSLAPNPAAMAAARSLAAELESCPPAGTVEIAAALVSVLLRFDPETADRAAISTDLGARAQAIVHGALEMPAAARRWTIPVAFGGENGPQIEEVAAILDLPSQAAVDELCRTDLRVLTIGFAPGQPYIGLLPENWDMPRLSELTPSVPAGALVVAVRQLVLFGAESATGWRHVGRAAFRSFVPSRAEPMPLRGGDAIRFAPAAADEIASLNQSDDGMGGARLEVLR